MDIKLILISVFAKIEIRNETPAGNFKIKN